MASKLILRVLQRVQSLPRGRIAVPAARHCHSWQVYDSNPPLHRHPSFFPQPVPPTQQRCTPEEYTVIDVETTGLNYSDKITEVAVIRVKDEEVVGQLTYLVDPGIPIPPKVVDITGIDDDLIRRESQGRTIADVLPEIVEFIGPDSIMVGHNIDFDMQFLRRESENAKNSAGVATFQNTRSFCTLRLAKRTLTHEPPEQLKVESLVRYFGIPATGFHRAMADVRATDEIFRRLCSVIGPEAQSWEHLRARTKARDNRSK
eukprot:TRINITY_DN28872_c0_g1_i1.p1 TRINITY_DN28872_c0_g1~~TRINITY_DN28872_c0_g1_i1.p1  ORF type:complete len:260 (-),score=10.84 TRINITY_DN28872_c0_g1_i1:11-790(-)